MVDLSVDLAGITLKNPLILASGIMGVSASSLKYVEENGAGAVTLKSIGPKDREGHHNPTVFAWGEGVANSVGLSNPGVEVALAMIKESMDRLSVPLIVSIFADKAENFVRVADKIMPLKPLVIEVNLSCPNTEDEFGKMFSLDLGAAERVVSMVRTVCDRSTKIFAKLTPEATDFTTIGKAVENAGADGITAINTVLSSIIDPYMGCPILNNKIGGISGRAIKPVGIEAVYNLYKTVKVPIIGTGGITTGEDAIEYIMAGATALGVGSAIYYRGIDVFQKIAKEMKDFMEKMGYKTITEMRGMAHRS